MERVPRDVVDLPADRDEHHLPPEPVRDRRAEQARVVALARARVAAAASSDGNAIRTMRPCAQSCSTETDSRGSRRFPRPHAAMRVLASGLCGSDVEKLGARAGGNGARARGRRSARGRRTARADPPPALRRVRALLGRARVDLRALRRPDDRARRLRRRGCRNRGRSSFPTRSTTRPAPTSSRSPASSAEPSASRADACSSSGRASSAGSSPRCCAAAATSVFASDSRPERNGREPDGPVDALVLCAPAAPLDALAPGGTVLVFAAAGPVDLDEVYRRELTLVGSRSATPAAMREAAALLPSSSCPRRRCSRSHASRRGSSSIAAAAR